jgi:hypothetical protein
MQSVNLDSLPKSSKLLGAHEKPILDSLTTHFQGLGYQAVPHVRFDLAWGAIISDLDLLLEKRGWITAIEVKSSHDRLGKARKQLQRISDYIDFAYVATERLPRKWDDPKIGVIHVTGSNVRFLKEAQRLTQKPRLGSLLALRKVSLLEIAGNPDGHQLSKYEIALRVHSIMDTKALRDRLKEVLFERPR